MDQNPVAHSASQMAVKRAEWTAEQRVSPLAVDWAVRWAGR